MSERTDDTTEGAAGSRPGREREPGGYYYDDGTGYEVYRPDEGGETDADDPCEEGLTRLPPPAPGLEGPRDVDTAARRE